MQGCMPHSEYGNCILTGWFALMWLFMQRAHAVLCYLLVTWLLLLVWDWTKNLKRIFYTLYFSWTKILFFHVFYFFVVIFKSGQHTILYQYLCYNPYKQYIAYIILLWRSLPYTQAMTTVSKHAMRSRFVPLGPYISISLKRWSPPCVTETNTHKHIHVTLVHQV